MLAVPPAWTALSSDTAWLVPPFLQVSARCHPIGETVPDHSYAGQQHHFVPTLFSPFHLPLGIMSYLLFSTFLFQPLGCGCTATEQQMVFAHCSSSNFRYLVGTSTAWSFKDAHQIFVECIKELKPINLIWLYISTFFFCQAIDQNY